jgi:iron-sulfur cluster assembly protein
MLTITEKALGLVRRIPDNPMLPATAGLRISRPRGATTSGRLRVEATAEPMPGDKVLDYDGGRVFLGRHAFEALKGKLLDARHDAKGRIEFLVRRHA